VPEQIPVPDESLEAGHEVRDVPVWLIAVLAVLLAFGAFLLHAVLWRVERILVPEVQVDGAAPPVVMPGEPPVNDRLREAGSPRLEGLEALQANPPQYRSSRPVPGGTSPDVRPEDLRADRQPALHEYGWVDRDKGIARIPIDSAMDAIARQSRNRGKK